MNATKSRAITAPRATSEGIHQQGRANKQNARVMAHLRAAGFHARRRSNIGREGIAVGGHSGTLAQPSLPHPERVRSIVPRDARGLRPRRSDVPVLRSAGRRRAVPLRGDRAPRVAARGRDAVRLPHRVPTESHASDPAYQHLARCRSHETAKTHRRGPHWRILADALADRLRDAGSRGDRTLG